MHVGYIVTSYAPEHQRGKYVASIWGSLSAGSTIGSSKLVSDLTFSEIDLYLTFLQSYRLGHHCEQRLKEGSRSFSRVYYYHCDPVRRLPAINSYYSSCTSSSE